MHPIEFLRQFHFLGYAIFDLSVAFLGVYLLSPILTKIFRKIGIHIPKRNWLFLTLPIGILAHLLVGNITPMTQNVMDIHGHYVLKIFLLILLFLGIKDIKVVTTKKKKVQ